MIRTRTLVSGWLLNLIVLTAFAQDPVVKNHWYFTGGVPFSPSIDLYGVEFGLNYVYHERISFEFSYNSLARDSQTLPADYVHTGMPTGEHAIMLALEAGGIVKLNKYGTIRLNLKGGLASVKAEVQNWTLNPTCQCYNVTVTYPVRPAIVLRPTLEIPTFSFLGLTTGPMVILSEGYNVFSWSAGFKMKLHARDVVFDQRKK